MLNNIFYNKDKKIFFNSSNSFLYNKKKNNYDEIYYIFSYRHKYYKNITEKGCFTYQYIFDLNNNIIRKDIEKYYDLIFEEKNLICFNEELLYKLTRKTKEELIYLKNEFKNYNNHYFNKCYTYYNIKMNDIKPLYKNHNKLIKELKKKFLF